MSAGNFVIGQPGQEPRFIVSGTAEEAESHMLDGDVCFEIDISEIAPGVISEDGTSLQPYVESVEEVRAQLMQLTRRVTIKAMALGCWSPLGSLNSDDKSQARLAGYAARAARDDSYSVTITMLDNTRVQHDAAAIIAAHDAMMDWANAVQTHSRNLKDALLAAVTMDDLDAIDPTADWPDACEPLP